MPAGQARDRPGTPVPAVRGGRTPRRAAANRASHRGPRPHEGTWCAGRTAVPGRCHRVRRGGRHGRSRGDAANRRRALRAVVKGVHAGDGEGGVRQPRCCSAEESLHHRHQRRRVAHQPRIRSGVRHRSGRRGRLRVLRPRRGRHGRREQELDQDHRRGDGWLRAGLLRLRLEEVGVEDDVASPLRAAADSLDVPRAAGPASSPAISSSSSSGSTCSRGDRRSGVSAQQSVRPRRGLGRAAAPDAGGSDPANTSGSTSSMPTRVAPRRACPAGSTPSCRPASSRSPGVLPRDEAIGRSKEPSRPPTAERGGNWSRRTSRPSTGRSKTFIEVALPRGNQRPASLPTGGSGARARVRPAGHGHDDGRARRRPARQRAASRRHLPVRRPRSGRSGTSRTWCRSGSRSICIQCGNCVMVCPHAAIRARYYDASALASGARPGSRRRRSPAAASRTCVSRCRSRSKTAPGASCASRSARREAWRRRASGPSTWKPKAPAPRARAPQSRILHDAARQPARRSRNVARPGHPVSDAAVRVLGRLRRLRRNALPAAAHPAVR